MDEKKKENIKSVIFLICFAAVILGMYISSQTEPTLCISCFGIIVFAIGCSMIYGIATEGLKDPRNLVFTILLSYGGICMMVLPPVLLYVPAVQSLDKTNLAMSFVSFGFLLTGAVILITHTIRLISQKKNYTVQVNAKCVDRELRNEFETNHRRHRQFFYIFQYWYNGQEYLVKDDTASNMDDVVKGFTYDLWLNPDNPEQFYRKTPKRNIVMYVLGGAFFIIGLIAFLVTL